MYDKTSWFVCASCLAVAMAGTQVRSQEAPRVSNSVEEVVTTLTEQLTSIDSLYCEYSRKFSNSESEKVRKRVFARAGAKWHATGLFTDGPETKEATSCCNGDLSFSYHVTRRQDGSEDWTTVQIHDPRSHSTLSLDLLLGVMLSNVQRSIVDVLGSSDITKSEGTLPDGTVGVRLIVRAVQSARADSGGTKYDVAVTLDPRHDFLPGVIVVTENEDTITAPGFSHHLSVLEYRRVLDERTRHKRWLPVSGVLKQAMPGHLDMPEVRIDVDKIQLNSKLAESLFTPDIPDDTKILDLTSFGPRQNGSSGDL